MQLRRGDRVHSSYMHWLFLTVEWKLLKSVNRNQIYCKTKKLKAATVFFEHTVHSLIQQAVAACSATATICAPAPCKWRLEQPPRAACSPWPLTFWPWNWHGQPSCQFWCFCEFSLSSYGQTCIRPTTWPHYLDLWPLTSPRMSLVRVIVLALCLHSRLRLRHGTDRQRLSTLNAPPYGGGGVTTLVLTNVKCRTQQTAML